MQGAAAGHGAVAPSERHAGGGRGVGGDADAAVRAAEPAVGQEQPLAVDARHVDVAPRTGIAQAQVEVDVPSAECLQIAIHRRRDARRARVAAQRASRPRVPVRPPAEERRRRSRRSRSGALRRGPRRTPGGPGARDRPASGSDMPQMPPDAHLTDVVHPQRLANPIVTESVASALTPKRISGAQYQLRRAFQCVSPAPIPIPGACPRSAPALAVCVVADGGAANEQVRHRVVRRPEALGDPHRGRVVPVIARCRDVVRGVEAPAAAYLLPPRHAAAAVQVGLFVERNHGVNSEPVRLLAGGGLR